MSMLLLGMVSAFAQEDFGNRVVEILEKARAAGVTINDKELENALNKVAGSNTFWCQSLYCDSRDEWVQYEPHQIVGVLTVGKGKDRSKKSQPMSFVVFPEVCKINGKPCDMLGYELALIGQQHKIGSDDYKEATKRFFGNDLDMVLAERDGGSRNYYLKNGMYVHHHIPGMIDKNSEIYGSVTFRRDEWKVKVVIGRDGAFLGEDNITRDGSYSR